MRDGQQETQIHCAVGSYCLVLGMRWMCMLPGPLQLVSNSGGQGDFIAVPVAIMVTYRVYGNNTIDDISLATRQATGNLPAVH